MGTTSVSTRKLLFRTLVVNSRPMMFYSFQIYDLGFTKWIILPV